MSIFVDFLWQALNKLVDRNIRNNPMQRGERVAGMIFLRLRLWERSTLGVSDI